MIRRRHARNEDNESICTACNGSGEGQYDGPRCSTCGGSGVVYEGEEDDEPDFDEPDFCYPNADE